MPPYPFPQPQNKILRNYDSEISTKRRVGNKWISKNGSEAINGIVAAKFIPELRRIGMMLPDQDYKDIGMGTDFCFKTIPDFNTLIAKSQDIQEPRYLH